MDSMIQTVLHNLIALHNLITLHNRIALHNLIALPALDMENSLDHTVLQWTVLLLLMLLKISMGSKICISNKNLELGDRAICLLVPRVLWLELTRGIWDSLEILFRVVWALWVVEWTL